MAIKTIFVCDVCGIQRGDVNHWFTVWLENNVYRNSGMENDPHVFNCKAGLDEKDEDVKHVCGAAHANTLFNKFVQYGTLEDPPIADVETREYEGEKQ